MIVLCRKWCQAPVRLCGKRVHLFESFTVALEIALHLFSALFVACVFYVLSVRC